MDLTFEDGRPVLKCRKGADRQPSALALEEAIHDRLPEQGLLDILARTAHEVGWIRHFGPASGSDPKIRGTMAHYVLMTFANGTLLGPAQVARYMRGVVRWVAQRDVEFVGAAELADRGGLAGPAAAGDDQLAEICRRLSTSSRRTVVMIAAVAGPTIFAADFRFELDFDCLDIQRQTFCMWASGRPPLPMTEAWIRISSIQRS